MTRLPVTRRAAAVPAAAALALAVAGCGSPHGDVRAQAPTTPATTVSPPVSSGRSGARHHRKPTPSSTLPATTVTAPSTSSTASTPTSSSSTSSTTSAPSSTTTTTTATGAGTVQVIADCQAPSYEPTTIVLACGDGAISATQISWTAWGATSAAGTAVIQANLCSPNCAQGSIGTFPADITLSGVTPSAGGPVFSTLTAHFTGASPNQTPTETYSIGPIS